MAKFCWYIRNRLRPHRSMRPPRHAVFDRDGPTLFFASAKCYQALFNFSESIRSGIGKKASQPTHIPQTDQALQSFIRGWLIFCIPGCRISKPGTNSGVVTSNYLAAGYRDFWRASPSLQSIRAVYENEVLRQAAMAISAGVLFSVLVGGDYASSYLSDLESPLFLSVFFAFHKLGRAAFCLSRPQAGEV